MKVAMIETLPRLLSSQRKPDNKGTVKVCKGY